MNASLLGWGTHLNSHIAQGIWIPQEARLYINMLELWALTLAWKAFLPFIRTLHLQVMSDSITTVVYINKQGEARSLPVCLEAVRLRNWCIRPSITIQMAYLPQVHNSLADSLSRCFSVDHEWEIYVLTDIFTQWGTPLWNFFASETNKKLPQYCSRGAISPDSFVSVSPHSNQNPPLLRTPDAGQEQGQIPQSRFSPPHGLVFGWPSEVEHSCLSPVQAILTHSRKESTRTCYLAKWKHFSAWVQHNQSHPVSSSIPYRFRLPPVSKETLKS